MRAKADPEWKDRSNAGKDGPDFWYAQMPRWEIDDFDRRLTKEEQDAYPFVWSQKAHEGQRPPGGDWTMWVIMARRGFGKTRAGAEWVRMIAETDPTARIALVAATLGEARGIMVEGESGILAHCPPDRRPVFEPSLQRLTWPAGAQAVLYSAQEPESLRGPQHNHAFGSGSERGLRQRGPRARRRPAALRDRRGSCLSPVKCGRGGSVARRSRSHRAVGGLACRQGGNWLFVTPRDGLRILDRSTGQERRFLGSWRIAEEPVEPIGGSIVDAEARAAISQLIAALRVAGIYPDNA